MSRLVEIDGKEYEVPVDATMADIEEYVTGKEPFDQMGSGYDAARARAAGMVPKPDEPNKGHMGSVAPTSPEERAKYGLPEESYVVLKGHGHESWAKAVAGEEARGFKIEPIDGRHYSVPKDWEPGNIDAASRKRWPNADGSFSTIRSKSFGLDGKEVLLPSLDTETGQHLSDAEILRRYRQDGKHLGIFATPEEATAYAKQLSASQTPANGEETTNEEADALLADIRQEIKVLQDKIDQLQAQRQKSLMRPGDIAEVVADQQTYQQRIDKLEDEASKYEVGHTGDTVGGIIGSVAGGAALSRVPFGPIIGVLGVGALGRYYGTMLHDIPNARKTREISEAEAVEIAKDRSIIGAAWDGLFLVLLGPGAVAVARTRAGDSIKETLKKMFSEAMNPKRVANAKNIQIDNAAESLAKDVRPGVSTRVSDAIGVESAVPRKDAAKEMIADVARKGAGSLPPRGQISGVGKPGEAFARSVSKGTFALNKRNIKEVADEIRDGALSELDNVGALGRMDLGVAIKRVVAAADKRVGEITGPIFREAEAVGAGVNMVPLRNLALSILKRDKAAHGGVLLNNERAELVDLARSLEDKAGEPLRSMMTMEGAQDFISGSKGKLRAMASIGEPTARFLRYMTQLTKVADDLFLDAIEKVPDKTLLVRLKDARDLYRGTMGDLYSKTLATAARRTPEDVGTALTSLGTITEIQELRAALRRSVELAADGNKMAAHADMLRIDAGLVKGFIAQQTSRLSNMATKIRDPKFLDTLKELMVGKGVANVDVNKRVLAELDKAFGLMEIMATDPVMATPFTAALKAFGLGGIGTGTVAVGLGAGLGAGAISAVTLGTVAAVALLGKLLAHTTAHAMTSGTGGSVRAITRALYLSKNAYKSKAAAEAANQALIAILAEAKAQGFDAKAAIETLSGKGPENASGTANSP